ncbi:MAG: hypothetical protein Q7T25_00350 [Sideroxyarcus sp.]|nr:hypothetical protein [Sideroxyarcus sp.]
MGLLDAMLQPQQAQHQGAGLLSSTAGLLSPSQGQSPAAGGGMQMAMQMVQQLAANPSSEVAQRIVQELQRTGTPESKQFEQVLVQSMGDPESLKRIADAVLQKMGSQ